MKHQICWLTIICLCTLAADPVPDEKMPAESPVVDVNARAIELGNKLGSPDPAVSDAAWGSILAVNRDSEAILVDLKKQGKLNDQAKTKLDQILAIRAPVDKAEDVTRQRMAPMNAGIIKLFIKAYDGGKHRSEKWDADVHSGFDYYGKHLAATMVGDRHNTLVRSSSSLERAIAAGCDDPAVLIVSTFDRERLQDFTAHQTHDRIVQAYNADKAAPTGPYIKCLIDGRMLRYAQLDKSVQIDMEAGLQDMVDSLKKAITDPDFTPKLAHDVAGNIDETCVLAKSDSKYWFDLYENDLEEQFPNSAPVLLHKGVFYVNFAWQARGGKVAGLTTDKQFKSFEELLGIAREALIKSWELDPHDVAGPRAMLKVELGLDGGRDEMEMWFKRGIACDPVDAKLYAQKRLYLEPKWHGSIEDMIQFGKECAATGWYSHRIPVILAETHVAVAKLTTNPAAYMQDPRVWKDISNMYDQLLRYYPNSTLDRLKYISYAEAAQQWAKVIEQIDQLSSQGDKLTADGAVRLNALRQRAQHELKN